MTANKNLLVGKWEFVGAQMHDGEQWESADYIEGMTWEFQPSFFSETKILGTIIESAPSNEDKTMLNYAFNKTNNCLKIEVYTDIETRIKDETDIYHLTQVKQSSIKTTITLELINQIGFPPPYLRYILQQGSTINDSTN